MVKGPWHRDPWRLGLYLGEKAGGDKQALGWAAVKLERPPIIGEHQRELAANERSAEARADALMREAEDAKRLHGADGFDGFTLYVYGSERSYRKWSRGAAEGMSRREHAAMVEDVARALRKRGQSVIIEKVP